LTYSRCTDKRIIPPSEEMRRFVERESIDIFVTFFAYLLCLFFFFFFHSNKNAKTSASLFRQDVLHAWRSLETLRVKLSMRWCRGWSRTGRVASLSSKFKSPKTQPFGIHFHFCRPIPSNVNLKKERPVCISSNLEGHGDHFVKLACGGLEVG
jgi:hypothetical protein